METLQKQVRQAHRRLVLQHFLRVACWSCFATMLAAVFVAFANWYWSWGLSAWMLLAGGFGAGLVIGCVWALLTRGDQMQAAIEIDKRFGLKERVSSALALDETTLESQAGRALKDDAVRRVKNLHVVERFGISLDRWSALPLAPAVAVLLLAFLLPDMTAKDVEAETTTMTPTERRELTKELRDLDKQLQAKIEKAKQQPGLKDAADLFKKLEQDRQQLAKNDMTDKKEALVKLNEMTKDLSDRQQKLEAQEKVKQQLSEIEGMNDGPADELAKSLQKGDLDKAMQQLQQLADKISKGELSEQDAAKLQNQIEKMKAKLDKAVENQKQKEKDLQKKIDQAKESGDQNAAQRLQKQLDQMQASQQQQQKMMEKLSDQLGQCAQCMSQGKGQEAADALTAMAGELGEMQYDAEELGMLSEMSDQLESLKSQLSGMGNGQGEGRGSNGDEGAGGGYADEKATNTGFHDSQASTKQENASGIVIGEVDGPNRKGIVREEIKNQMNETNSDSTDPLTNQKLNRSTRDHVRDYFEKFRQGGSSSSSESKKDGDN